MEIQRKKLACSGLDSTIAIKSRILQVFIMKLMIAAKRLLFVLFTASAITLYAAGVAEKGPCPLPADGSSTQAADANSQSPEKEPCMKAVHHNGFVLCLPCPAYAAHIRHGDTDAGPCDKPGRVQ
ncbi:MAG TPA: hypothetical protein VM940_04010 [Chthoniobacterales bacterium]|jgi:hypothetical protein|nr:hypothetical protein [Chthoniobacterales bacterium]